MDASRRVQLYGNYASGLDSDAGTYIGLGEEVAGILMDDELAGWEQGLQIIEAAYRKRRHRLHIHVRLSHHNCRLKIPQSIATKVLETPELYPCNIVTFAEMKNRELLASVVVPVGTVAQQEGWFDDSNNGAF